MIIYGLWDMPSSAYSVHTIDGSVARLLSFGIP